MSPTEAADASSILLLEDFVGPLWAHSGLLSEPPRMAAVENTRVTFRVFPRLVAREAHMKYSSASGASGEIQIVILRCVLRGHSGEGRKK